MNPNPTPQPAFTPHVPPVMEPLGDATGGVIPYKNPQALLAYYLGMFGMIPCLGMLFSIPAIVLGFYGLRAARITPSIKGTVHARIGIVLGLIATLLTTIGVVIAIFSICLQIQW